MNFQLLIAIAMICSNGGALTSERKACQVKLLKCYNTHYNTNLGGEANPLEYCIEEGKY